MGDLQKVTVRIPSDTVVLLQELVDRGEFVSMAEAVNCAVEDLIGERFTPEDRIEVVSHSEDNTIDIGALIQGGTDPFSGDEIRDAVRAYVRSRMG